MKETISERSHTWQIMGFNTRIFKLIKSGGRIIVPSETLALGTREMSYSETSN